ncbi:MAG: HAD-IA family hydrolase [Rhizobiaceae bacterium]
MNNPVSALIFDFGGVITRTMFETHDLTEKVLGLNPGSLQWRGPFDPKNDQLWQAMQAGQISEREYWGTRTNEVAKRIGADWKQMSDFVKAARGASPAEIIRPDFLKIITKANTAGIRLAILSNELDLFYGADFREKLPFLQYFEVIHDATYTKVLKPDPRAYESCLDDLKLAPGQCVFIDDQWRNIQGAKNIGLQTIHFDVTKPAVSYDAVRQFANL